LIEKLLFSLVIGLRLVSLENVRPESSARARHVFMDLYVLAFTALLTSALFLQWPHGLWIVMIVAYRLFDIVTYRVYFLLVKSQEKPWTLDMLRRSITIVALNFYEATAAFAVLYRATGEVHDSQGRALASSIASLYYSLVTMATLGYGDFAPSTDLTRFIVICQICTSLLLLAFIIPGIISLFTAESDPDSK
jgi:hypothetical protein